MPSETPTVLVTGATGLVGVNLVELLLADGSRVIAVATDEFPAVARDEFARHQGRLVHVQLDIRDAKGLIAAIDDQRVDAIVHAAAITAGPGRAAAEADHIMDVNIGGTQSALEVAALASVPRFVYASSGAVYGAVTFGRDPIDETTPPDPGSLYAMTKLAAETLARTHAEDHPDCTVAVARLSAVFGPWERDTGVRDTLSPMFQAARALARGATVRYPVDEAARNWLYARDAARALARLALGSTPRHLVYNVSPPAWSTVGGFLDRLAAAHPDHSPPGEGAALELTFDADPGRRRAPVSADRFRAETPGWPAHTPEEAYDDYLDWLATHPVV